MQVWLLDYEKFIKVNGLQEVTDPIMFDNGNIPSKNGLFSTEIFGTTTSDRRETFAYISLEDYYINPKVYLSLLRLNRKFQSVVYGTKRFSIKDGLLVEDENGGTGIKWLYDNWDKIAFKKNDSNQRKERIDLITNNPKNIIFTNKFVVIPAFYRDVNIQGNEESPKVLDINNMYASIIRNVRTIRESTTMEYVVQAMRGKVQDLIVEIYNTLKDKIQGKRGYIRQFLLGKTIDYGSRVVITAGVYRSNTVYDQQVGYYYTGIPLAQVCSEFTPFMIYWIKNWFKNNMENQASSFLLYDEKKDKKELVKLDNPEAYFNETYIENMLAQFVKNPYTRFNKIEIPVSKKDMERLNLKKYPTYRFVGMKLTEGQIGTMPESPYQPNVTRDFTWTDLIYMAAVDVTSDKHVWITRYPLTDYMGSYTTRIAILSTRDTTPMMFGNRLYRHYPVIDLQAKLTDMDVLFRDTLNICPLYLSALGADHDGDQITSKGVYTQEANEECEKILMSKSNLLSVRAGGIRNIGNEGTQTLYTMTRFR